jgi:hypothetical protein
MTVAPDPFAVLGLPRTATAADVLAARRQIAKRLHPDALATSDETARKAAGAQLAQVNRAVELALAALDTPTPTTRRPTTTTSTSAPATHRTASFGIEVLPVEAFELVMLAMSAIGDPKVIDEPYLVEGMVDDPSLCLCRIDLVPEAGGTIVTVEVHPMVRAGVPPPSAVDVAGRLIAEIEALGPNAEP